jgi:hypothetical protein
VYKVEKENSQMFFSFFHENRSSEISEDPHPGHPYKLENGTPPWSLLLKRGGCERRKAWAMFVSYTAHLARAM